MNSLVEINRATTSNRMISHPETGTNRNMFDIKTGSRHIDDFCLLEDSQPSEGKELVV